MKPEDRKELARRIQAYAKEHICGAWDVIAIVEQFAKEKGWNI